MADVLDRFKRFGKELIDKASDSPTNRGSRGAAETRRRKEKALAAAVEGDPVQAEIRRRRFAQATDDHQ